MDKPLRSEEDLLRELAYYKNQLDQLSGQSMRNDLALTSLRHRLKQKDEALAVFSILQEKYDISTPIETLFSETVKAIGVNLGMDRTVLLVPVNKSGTYKLSHSYGYAPDYFSPDKAYDIHFSANYLKEGQSILVNKKTPPDEDGLQVQSVFSIPFFVGVPIIHNEQVIAFIIAGRKIERAPFSPLLDKGDVDSMSVITGLVTAVLQNQKSVKLEMDKRNVEKENKIIAAQRDQLEQTLGDLKKAQVQLIHAEKMASLGELTAGIAHEIQNPLNFVNNFSEVSVDLLQEMQEELEEGNAKEADEISKDLKENLEKITLHGKRASSIVKGMLEHSRAGDGHKEATDINILADEYLRLAYHGLKAKDKSFNADFKLELDESIPKIKVVPQDLGRVLLNLINNAFYAVNAKSTTGLKNYNPRLSIRTQQVNEGVEIRVKDNGLGIPEHLLKKIFQPFFTTKPTGEGTGLGLSLSYDIITKGHGGTLKVNTHENEGTEFIIQLPIK